MYKKFEYMLSLFRKYVIKLTAVTVLFITLFQSITYSTSASTNDMENGVRCETISSTTTDFHISPGKLENDLKKFERSSDKAVSESKNLNNEKFIYSDEIERCIKTKLLYYINITNDINYLRLVTNNLDLRSPPLFHS